jgi:hypothetical protein
MKNLSEDRKIRTRYLLISSVLTKASGSLPLSSLVQYRYTNNRKVHTERSHWILTLRDLQNNYGKH